MTNAAAHVHQKTERHSVQVNKKVRWYCRPCGKTFIDADDPFPAAGPRGRKAQYMPETKTETVTIPLDLWYLIHSVMTHDKLTFNEVVIQSLETTAECGLEFLRDDQIENFVKRLRPQIPFNVMSISEKQLLKFFINVMTDDRWTDLANKGNIKTAMAEFLANNFKEQLAK